MTEAAKKEYHVTFFGIGQYKTTIIAFDERQLYGRSYEDESEMIQIANPFLLSAGGDIRHVMHFVKQRRGWQKHLWLTKDEAELLGYGIPV
jgi:hypothetical protein